MLVGPVALYLLALLVGSLPLTFVALGALALVRAWRRTALGVVDLQLEPRTARPGGKLRARARVVPRREGAYLVSATLQCTLFDHRARRLFSRSALMQRDDHDHDLYLAELDVPASALRTGVVGDELSTLFSEQARRLLAFWTVVFEVKRADKKGQLVYRSSLPVDVPEGRPLSTDEKYLSQLVVETFASLRDEMIFNWLVKMASHDGDIAESERQLLHEVLASAHGITDPAAADARIEVERRRELDIDAELLRRHVPIEARVQFYKLLFAVAWRDGTLDQREHALLMDTLRSFGLDRHHVREVELEVLRGAAAKSFR
jgi:uncharacterized tellurite resistance protein B-like protein